MTLRRRITLVGAAAVAIAVAFACTTAYVVVRDELLSQVDAQLRQQRAAFERFARLSDELALPDPPRGSEQFSQLSPQQGGPLAYVQALSGDGRPRSSPSFSLPVDDVDRAVAAGRRGAVLRDRTSGEVELRVLTIPIGDGKGAVQLGRPMNSIHSVLDRLRVILILVCIGGVALAALLGRVVTRRLTAPLRTVAEAADHIAETDDLARRIDITSADEVGQLARRFNGMLDRLQASREALAGSVAAQRQLVADASHELRTPITTVRTNLEVLAAGEFEPEARDQVLSELIEQTEDLGALVADVIELARGDADPDAIEDVRLDEVTAVVVEGARRHHRHVVFVVRAEPVVLDGARDRLGRAISNLLDNAAKHSPPGKAVDVFVDATGVCVRDYGPGVADADLPHLFDRFYRGATARRLPGTGLGLAIVQQVAQAHGGAVEVRSPDGGGAEFHLRLEARAVRIHGHSLA